MEWVSRHGRVLRVAVASEQAGNTLSSAALAEATPVLREPDGVGAVLLTSNGAQFCTGGNVRDFAANGGDHVGEVARGFHEFVLALATTPVPVVAAVSGWAAGAGMSMVCVCDVIVGGPSTRFRPAYPSIGFSPDGGMTWTLPRLVGAARARDLILTDTVLTGSEAFTAGLLTRLVPDEEVQQTAMSVATRLADGPTSSLARTRRLLVEAPLRPLAEHLDAEAQSIAACADSPAGREGMAAFLERRPPQW